MSTNHLCDQKMHVLLPWSCPIIKDLCETIIATNYNPPTFSSHGDLKQNVDQDCMVIAVCMMHGGEYVLINAISQVGDEELLSI